LDSPTSNASDSAGNTAFQTVKRQQASKILSATTRQAFQTRRAYSSEIAQAMVEVSKNIGMGTAAVGLTGAGIGIGLVFASLLSSVARNPALRGQLFTYAILGFAFVEAIGLFDLMVALMAKFVCLPEDGENPADPPLPRPAVLTFIPRPKRRTSPRLRRLGSHDHDVGRVRSERVSVPRGMSLPRLPPRSIGFQHRLIEALRRREAWGTIEGRLCIALSLLYTSSLEVDCQSLSGPVKYNHHLPRAPISGLGYG
jgi:F-type H+-transporting ATPase subunit c